MNAGKRITALLILSMLLITLSLYPVRARGTSGDNSQNNINLVIILDRTASLQQSDPNRLSQEAAKLIVDLMLQNGSKIGLVQYTDKVTGRLDITEINGQGEKIKLKSYIDGLGLPMGQSTDISAGLKEGVSMLAGLQTMENPVIILLTDGKNDFNGSDRTPDISQRDLDQALNMAQDKRIFVYTIGLNADGSVDKDMLSQIAKVTGVKSYIVNQANDLPDVTSDIYADALGYKILPIGLDGITLSGDFDTYSFDVTNSSVAEANIVIYKNGNVQVKLIQPDGTEVSWDSDRFIASLSRNYDSYKILNPAKGQWRLMIKGERNEGVKISLLYNYDLTIQMDPLPSRQMTDTEVHINASLMRQGMPLEDESLYKDMSAVAIVENSSAKVSEKVSLTVGETKFQGTIKFVQPGDYNIYVQAGGKDLIRKSSLQSIQIIEKSQPEGASSKPLFPWKKGLYIFLGILLTAFLLILLLKGIPKLVEKTKPKLLFGKINLRVINTQTGMEEMQQSKILAPYGTSVTIRQLTENPASSLNTVVIARNAKGIYLTYSGAGREDLSVSVNGDKVAPGQIVLLTHGCSLRVVAAAESLKVEGRFSEF